MKPIKLSLCCSTAVKALGILVYHAQIYLSPTKPSQSFPTKIPIRTIKQGCRMRPAKLSSLSIAPLSFCSLSVSLLSPFHYLSSLCLSLLSPLLTFSSLSVVFPLESLVLIHCRGKSHSNAVALSTAKQFHQKEGRGVFSSTLSRLPSTCIHRVHPCRSHCRFRV
jgi:hypothetical protein